MAEKRRVISPDLVIHPGETIYDLLQDRGITQKELALRAGVSESFLSDVIHGKKDISKSLALGLQYVFDVPSSFWLNLQANYDAEILALDK
jgi:addiction module HigA family antidote